MKKQFLTLLLAGCLLLTGCSASSLFGFGSTYSDWEKAEKTASHAVETGKPDSAKKVLAQYLKANSTDAEAYENAAEFYRGQMDDPDGALEILQQGIAALLKSDEEADINFLTNEYHEILLETGTVPYPSEYLPSHDEILLDGKPFADYTPEELKAWMPESESVYENEDDEEDDWYVSADYKNEVITISYTEWDSSCYMTAEFDSLGVDRSYHDYTGPDPELPCGIEQTDDFYTACEKLGIPEAITTMVDNPYSVYISQQGDDCYVFVSASSGYDGDYQMLTVRTSGRNGNDLELQFTFMDGTLYGYRMELSK